MWEQLPSKHPSQAQLEVARVAARLFASATEDQKSLLQQLGLAAPEQTQPDLVISSHLDDIRKVVEDLSREASNAAGSL